MQGLGLDLATEQAMAALGLEQELHRHSLPMPVELNRAVEGRCARTLTRDPAYNNRRCLPHWRCSACLRERCSRWSLLGSEACRPGLPCRTGSTPRRH